MNNRENRRARRSTGRHPVSKTDIGRGNFIAALIFLIPVLLGAGIVLHARAAGSTTQAVASTPADTQSGYATASDTATTSDPNVHEVNAKDLKPGDAVVMKDGRTEIVKSVTPETAPDDTQVASTDTPPSSDAAASSSSDDEWILAPDHVSPPLSNGDPAPLPVAHSAQDPGFHVVKLLKTETDGNKIILTGTNQDTGKPETIVGMRGRDTVFTLSDPSKAKLPTKGIQDVKQGDLVATRNPATGVTEFRRVTQTYKHLAYETITAKFADARSGKIVDTVDATPEHPFFVPGRGAIPLRQLGVGTQVVTRAGPPLVITALIKHEHPQGIPVYNFQVKGDHTYFVGKAHGGTWVHNDCTPTSLFHYTTEEGMNGIVDSESLNPSLKAVNPADARYGDGQYLSDIAPGSMSPSQLSRQFLGMPFQGSRFTNYVEIDTSGLNVVQGRAGVYVIPNSGPLNLAGRILSSGAVP